MADNWVERRAAREKHLGGASEVWQQALTAIDDSCNSFKSHYSDIGSPELTQQNGHRIIVALKFTTGGKRRFASIFFDESKPQISVAVDDGAAKNFKIEADDSHCFIKSPTGQEISADEFSRLALEDVLFKGPVPAAKILRGSSGSRHTEWS
jgi:hypothetical protein